MVEHKKIKFFVLKLQYRIKYICLWEKMKLDYCSCKKYTLETFKVIVVIISNVSTMNSQMGFMVLAFN